MPTSKANSITLNNDTEYDELYDEAVKFVTESNKSSIADIQKQFQIGYNRPSGLIIIIFTLTICIFTNELFYDN